MRRFWILSRSLMLMHLRDRAALFWFFLFPVGLLLVFGLVFGRAQGPPGIDIPTWFTAGIVVMNIMSAGLAGDSAWLATARDRGVLQRVRATPLPPAALIGAYVAVRLLLVLVQSALIVAIAALVLGARIEWDTAAAVVGLVLLGGCVFILLGQAIGAVSSSARSAEAAQNAVFFPLLFLSDLVVLATDFPVWLHELRRWNPAYMLVDLVRPALTGYDAAQAPALNLVGLAIWSAVGLAVAARWFRWEPRR